MEFAAVEETTELKEQFDRARSLQELPGAFLRGMRRVGDANGVAQRAHRGVRGSDLHRC